MMSLLCEVMRIYQMISLSFNCHCPFRDFHQDSDIKPATRPNLLEYRCVKSGTGRLHQIFRMQVQRAKRTSKRAVSSTNCLIRSRLDNSKHFAAHPRQTSSWGRNERRVLYAHLVIGGEVIGSNQSLFRRFVRVLWTAELLHHSAPSSRSTFATTALQGSRASILWARFLLWETFFCCLLLPFTSLRHQSQKSEGSRRSGKDKHFVVHSLSTNHFTAFSGTVWRVLRIQVDPPRNASELQTRYRDKRFHGFAS